MIVSIGKQLPKLQSGSVGGTRGRRWISVFHQQHLPSIPQAGFTGLLDQKKLIASLKA
jgi:hypothetical protein